MFLNLFWMVFIHTLYSSNPQSFYPFSHLTHTLMHTHTQTEQSLTGRFSQDNSSPVPRPMSCLVLFNIATDRERREGEIETWADGREEVKAWMYKEDLIQRWRQDSFHSHESCSVAHEAKEVQFLGYKMSQIFHLCFHIALLIEQAHQN